MQNIETKTDLSKPSKKTNSEALSTIKSLYGTFLKEVSRGDAATFFALCHAIKLGSYASVVSKPDVDSIYSDAVKNIEKLRRCKSSLIGEIEGLFKKSSSAELIISFSAFHEMNMKRQDRSKLGAFYTPVSYCIEALEVLTKGKSVSTVYDPFCGGGAWLCAFLLNRTQSLFDLAAVPVFGTDIDETAVVLARLNVSHLLPNNADCFLRLNKQIRVLNSLYPAPIEAKVIEKFAKSCDLVATNPPYGFAIDLENKQFISTGTRIPDKEIFYYAISTIRSLVPDSTPTAFLVPNTFLFNLGSRDFRRHLTASFKVNIWDHTKSDIFQSATVRTALLELEAGSKKAAISYRQGFEKKSVRLSDIDFVEANFKNNKSHAIAKNSVPLSTFFDVSQGLIPYDKYRGHTKAQITNRVFHSETKLDRDYKRELQGKDVSPFAVSWGGKSWIKYGEWLAAPRSPRFFNEPRVLIREITSSNTGRLHCGYTDAEFYNTPSIINVVCRTTDRDTERRLKTLAVLLSSTAFARYHLETSPKANKGVFPKILVNDVRNLPLPENFLTLDYSKLYDRAAKMVAAGAEVEEIAAFIDENLSDAAPTRKAA